MEENVNNSKIRGKSSSQPETTISIGNRVIIFIWYFVKYLNEAWAFSTSTIVCPPYHKP